MKVPTALSTIWFEELGDEDFISDVEKWNDSEMTKKRQEYANNLDKVYENDQRIPK